MKAIFFTSIFFLTFTSVNGQIFPVQIIKNNGTSDKRINIVFLADGYTSAEQGLYLTNVTNVVNTMFSQTPFLQYEQFFNVYAIQVPSIQSGAIHPATAYDEPGYPVTNPNNYYGSSFDTYGIHRLLVPSNVAGINSTMIDNAPFYDQIFVLVNSSIYGGSGGTYATASTDPSSAEVAIHEIGHSFAGLADEYATSGQGEKPNRTVVTNPATIKWKNWLGVNGIGIYPIGIEGWQRPHQNCKMQFLGVPFCSVCKEAFINKIYSLVSPIDHFTPVSNAVSFLEPSMNFSLGLILPNPNTLNIAWVLNGVTIANNVNNVDITALDLNEGNNTLVANVTDATTLSRAYLPATSGYLNTVTWTITKSLLPIELIDFEAVRVENHVDLTWETASESNTSFFDIQKSSDGITFKNIGKVNAAGQSTSLLKYQFTDYEPLNNIIYYRLQAVDNDGKKQLSPIKVVNRIDKMHYEIYPSPVSDLLTVSLSSQYAEDIEIFLFDLQGKLLKTILKSKVNDLFEQIDMTHFAPGNYILKVQMGDNVIEKQITKQ